MEQETSQEPRHHVVLKFVLVLLGLLVVGVVLLVLYNSSVVRPKEVTSSPEFGKQSWSPTAVVINDVSVPPEPDPTINNATLAGVDSNSNGVRDDVERVIAREFGTNPEQFKEVFAFSQAESRVIVDPSPANVAAYTRAVDCSTVTADQLDKVTFALLNTQERRRAYATANAGAIGGACDETSM